jgi:hypothetical protein
MPRSKPAYPAEIRQRILELARSGRSVASLAKELEPGNILASPLFAPLPRR